MEKVPKGDDGSRILFSHFSSNEVSWLLLEISHSMELKQEEYGSPGLTPLLLKSTCVCHSSAQALAGYEHSVSTVSEL